MKLQDIITRYRNEHKVSMETLGKASGLSKPYISMLEKGINPRSGKPVKPSIDTCYALAKGMGMSSKTFLSMLDEDAVVELAPNAVKIPILGSIVAGQPVEAIEDIRGYVDIPESMAVRGDYFALKVKGESMAPRIMDGDTVIVREQPTVDDGDIAIVLVNSQDATVKQIRISEQGITLIGFNPIVYQPHFYTNEDINTLPVLIIGKVVELRAKL